MTSPVLLSARPFRLPLHERPESRPRSSRPPRSRTARSRFAFAPGPVFFGPVFFGPLFFGVLLAGCATSRPPATGAPDDPSATASETGDAGMSSPAAEGSERSESSLTQDEILALPPEVGVEADLLDVGSMSIEELNEQGVLADVQFGYDSADLSAEARATLERNAAWLNRYPTVRVLVEGHCDERGTVEYNLALGEGRARAVQDYLVRLGVSADRLQIISYGKEFPLDPGHDETAWRRNRRGHLEIIGR